MTKQKLPVIMGVVAGVLLLAMPLYLTNRYYQNRMAEILIAAILALALWIIMGAGEINFGQAGFMCIGAYTSTLLMMRAGINFWLALPAAGVAAAAVGLPIGFIGLRRVRHVYFFMFSLSVGESIKLTAQYWKSLTGGINGIPGIPRPELLGISLASPVAFYYLCLPILLITLGVIYVVWNSRFGNILRAVRGSEKLTGAFGISAFAYRNMAWLLCCFFAGIAGGLSASFVGFVSPNEFGVMKTNYPLVHILIGGRTSPFGPLIGTALMMLFSTGVRDIAGAPYWVEPLSYGMALLIVLIGLRSGIWEFLIQALRPQEATPEKVNLSGVS
jgi:branched-chain amino acid transport system permease protein